MPFPWAAAAGLIASAASAYLDHLKARADAEQRARDRDSILNAIAHTRDQILTEMVRETIAELSGELEGFQSTYGAYDPDPDDPVEEERLARLIDDSARTLGRLGALIDGARTNPALDSPGAQLALQSWPIYLSVLYLRSQAMTERQVTFGAAELKDSLPEMDAALMRLDGLLTYLRKQSHARFGAITFRVREKPPSIVTFYSFLGEQFVCAMLPKSPKNCELARARHMDTAYAAFEGVRELREVNEQLNNVRDALETVSVIDLITHRDPGDLVSKTNALTINHLGRLELPLQ